MTICPNAEKCGGCLYQGVPHKQQLEEKNAAVLGFLTERNIRCGEYAGVFAPPAVQRYRNKMEYSFGDEEKGGVMNLGLHRKRSYMAVIETDGCVLVPEDFETIRKRVLDFTRGKNYSFRHKKTRSGFLRNLIIRSGMRTNELLVNLVTTSDDELDAAGFVSCIHEAPLNANVAGILHTVYDGRADTAGCDELRVLYGHPHYTEKLLGLDFTVGAFTFFQTNVPAAERLFEDAFDLLPDISSKHVYDVYCGTGALSLMLAKRAKNVTGIEIVSDSVDAARANAALNGIMNCEFICGDAFEVMDSLRERPDTVVVDPPRMGMHPKALKKLISYDLPELLYISCNPKTFCADMAALQDCGYKLDVLRSYDNFPFTRHIELASRIIRR
ncbi:MAG: 23S rRNA (uracil(1939)-C(5))-methyltransferase RlmD [Clostridiales Family XIII bacterium]|jgi:23S rRNA (uracil-5-)-methyltransferase RumA|nr:23S rRNA (uracil(1939)-C(5))-methyltransferase RlmD [Clostridiales Family XIII bacterium]